MSSDRTCGTCAYLELSCSACFCARSSHCSEHRDKEDSCSCWAETLASDEKGDEPTLREAEQKRKYSFYKYWRLKAQEANAIDMKKRIERGEITDPAVIAQNEAMVEKFARAKRLRAESQARYKERHRAEYLEYQRNYQRQYKRGDKK